MKKIILESRPRGFRASAVIIKNDKILLMHQIYKGEDFYNLPGGGLENNETLEQACRREVREETGLKVKIKKLIYILDTPSRLNFVFRCYYRKGRVKLGGPEQARMNLNDQYSLAWIDINKLKKINLQPTATKKAIFYYLHHPKSKTFYINQKKLIRPVKA
jgi:ADP-ribose pyrophosphatase YjhB (NUDIX family)